MDGLAAFLTARLDEREAAARTAAFQAASDEEEVAGRRALREVEADRAILTLLEQDVTDGRERDYDATEALEQVARIRAAVYDAHPDYRPEWKPQP